MRGIERLLAMVVGVGIVGAYTSSAAACETDAECGAGYVCTTYEYTMPDCPDGDMEMPDCPPDGTDCEASSEAEKPICEDGEVVVESYCERAPCETDADCGDGMVCNEYIDEWCEGSAGSYCDEEGCYTVEEEEEQCGTDVYRECGYPYEGSCEVDADCGDGFDCVNQEVCWCTGSDMDSPDMTDAVDGEGGEDAPVIGDECGCEPTGDTYCQLREIPCESDADCPVGLTCDAGDSVGTACIEYDDGTVACDEPAETVAMCRPVDWYEDVDRDGDSDGDIISGGDGDTDVDIDADSDVDIDVDGGIEDGDNDDHTVFDDIDINLSINGCAVSTPAHERAGFNLLDMFALLTR